MGLIDLANEYAQITGRPLATLSVSEFIELKRFSGMGINSMNTSSELFAESTDAHAENVSVPAPATKENTVSDNVHNAVIKIEETDMDELFPDLKQKEKEEKQAKTYDFKAAKEASKVQTTEKDDEEAILKALKSISG